MATENLSRPKQRNKYVKSEWNQAEEITDKR